MGYAVTRQQCFFGAYVSTACNISMQYELAVTINRGGVPSTRVSTCSFLKKWPPALHSTAHRLAYIWWEAQSPRQVLGEQCHVILHEDWQPAQCCWILRKLAEDAECGGREEGGIWAVCGCEAFVWAVNFVVGSKEISSGVICWTMSPPKNGIAVPVVCVGIFPAHRFSHLSQTWHFSRLF